MFTFDKALLIHDIDLWLDSTRVKEFGFISHGHTDHIARHRRILCSPPTADFVRIRLKNPQCQPMEYNTPVSHEDATLTIFPAGHILGSAQIKIEQNGCSLLYTGDFRISPGRTAEPFEFVHSDILVMESTFGLPQYTFPERRAVEEELVELCSRLLKQGKTPLVLAYTLGKGQEALKILSDAHLPVAADLSILNYVPIYQKYGVAFNSFTRYRKEDYHGRILLFPVHSRFRRELRAFSNVYTIFLSGWAMDATRFGRMRVDKILPLSDHADYNELIHLVETVKPHQIYCTHGFEQFVDTLNHAGYRASLLK